MNNQKGFVIPLIIIIVLLIGGLGYVGYTKFQDKPPISSTATPVNQETDTQTSGEVMKGEDYGIKYIPASDRQSNTLRFQFYGPAKIQGYDPIEGKLVNADTEFRKCKGRKCNVTNQELRFDLVQQGRSGDDRPLVSLSLRKIQEEYQKYVEGGKAGEFKSSVISFALPTPPPKVGIADTAGWNLWVGAVYYDNNGNKQDDVLDDWDIAFTDGIVYLWQQDKSRPNSFVPGWNFEITTNPKLASDKAFQYKNDPAGSAQYRKSFENQIVLIPILETKTVLYGAKDQPRTSEQPAQSAADSKNERLKGALSSLRAIAEVVYDSNGGSYKNICRNGGLNENESEVKNILTKIRNNKVGLSSSADQKTLGIVCMATETRYAISLKSNDTPEEKDATWCIDRSEDSSRMRKGEIDAVDTNFIRCH